MDCRGSLSKKRYEIDSVIAIFVGGFGIELFVTNMLGWGLIFPWLRVIYMVIIELFK